MLLLMLTRLTFAETSTESNTETSEETPVKHTLLYSGTDDQASLIRTSLAADVSTEQLQLQKLVMQCHGNTQLMQVILGLLELELLFCCLKELMQLTIFKCVIQMQQETYQEQQTMHQN